jgi:hypothetical protein
MRNSTTATFLGFIFLAAGATIPAHAASVTFDFNSLSSYENSTQIGAYMTGVLTGNGCLGCSVSVVGAVADQSYNGDGNVVGPKVSGVYKSVTLGDTNGATSNSATPSSTYDTFIANTNDSSHSVSSEISLVFSGLTINSTGFDFEIFPDGSSQQPPEFTFTAGTSGIDSPVTAFGTGGTVTGVLPATGTNGSNELSPASGGGIEQSAQYIGTWSGSLGGVTDLNFIDWPATIGVDNLSINYDGPPQPTPEPASIFLLGTVAAGVFLVAKRRMTRVTRVTRA